MGRVKINTDKMANDLLSSAKVACDIGNSVRDCASRVDFPYEDYGWWNDVYNNVCECLDCAQRYHNWVSDLSTRFASQIQQSVDEVNGISVEKIQKPKISVN